MIQPIRPQDATGVYQRQAVQDAEAGPSTHRNGGTHAPGRRSDRVTISSQAQELHRVMASVQDADEVRAALVQQLQSQVASGQYRVDPDGVARLLVERGIAL